MSDKIRPVKLDNKGHVIPAGKATRVEQWRVTIGKKITGDKKQRRFFSTEKEAKDWITEKTAERKEKGQKAFAITDKLRVEALECEKRLVVAGVSLTQVVDYYLRHALPAGGKKTFQEVADEFLTSRKAMGCKSKTMTQYDSYMNVIKEEWADENIHEIKQADLEDWLSESEWAPRTRKNYIVTMTTVLNFAISREYCVNNPAAKVPRPILDDKAPGILTPAEATTLLAVSLECTPELTDGLAIGLFAGLRRSELCALDWSEIDLASRFIEVKAGKAKTRKRRLVTISDNLALWLARNAQKSGPVVHRLESGKRIALGVDVFGEKLKHLVRGRPKTDDDEGRPAIKDPWPHNAIRHSFGSYYYGKSKNENTTAAEMGNSPQMVFQHYRELVKPHAIEAYWKITPDPKLAVIIPFKKATK
jgi:integrase